MMNADSNPKPDGRKQLHLPTWRVTEEIGIIARPKKWIGPFDHICQANKCQTSSISGNNFLL